MEKLTWLKDNYQDVLLLLGTILTAGQIFTRLTPTKKDDGFVTRIGVLFDKLCDILKVPNVKRKTEN